MKKILCTLLALFALNAFALTVDGINFEDKVNVGGKDLVLNGVGIRKATFLKIKVYYGGLYLTSKSSDPGTFLNSPEPKQIVMHFVRDVSAKDLKKTYVEAMEKANGAAAKPLMPTLEKFLVNVSDIAKGERMIVSFFADGVVLNFKGKAFDKVASPDFSKALLNIWFTNPLDENLKTGLLGK